MRANQSPPPIRPSVTPGPAHALRPPPFWQVCDSAKTMHAASPSNTAIRKSFCLLSRELSRRLWAYRWLYARSDHKNRQWSWIRTRYYPISQRGVHEKGGIPIAAKRVDFRELGRGGKAERTDLQWPAPSTKDRR